MTRESSKEATLKKSTLVLLASITVTAATIGAAAAQSIPKAGTFSIHSGWKSVGEMTQVAEGHFSGAGNFWGITYNDSGRGLLHIGAVLCPYSLDVTNGAGPGKGTCAWGDADGDKIFTDWSGMLKADGTFDGMNQITGGTGKFTGVQGKAPFHCKALNASGQWTCTQQFEYRLP
jgi:hypothetical protein